LGDPSSENIDVALASLDSIVYGLSVYVEGAGFYRVTQFQDNDAHKYKRNKRDNIVHLELEQRLKDDGYSIKVGQKVILVGERGRDAEFYSEKRSNSLHMISDSFVSKKRNDDSFTIFSGMSQVCSFIKTLSNIYVKDANNNVLSPKHNSELFGKSMKIVSQSCPEGQKIFSGNCKWDLLKFKSSESWCRSKDFQINENVMCVDCLINSETKKEIFNGKLTEVLTKLTFRDLKSKEHSFDLNERSCQILETTKTDESDMEKCGMFCLFSKVDPITISDSVFSCRYIPPSVFGADQFFGISKRDDQQFVDKIQIISTEIVCVKNNN